MTKRKIPKPIVTVWQGITLAISYDPASFGSGAYVVAHLEIMAVQPDRAPLPVTETGYRSHFVSPVYIEDAGGPIAYALTWLDAEAAKPAWRRYVEESRQLSLF